MIVDLVGKGRRVRTEPMPPWTKNEMDRWIGAAAIDSGLLFRPVNKGGMLPERA